MSSLDPKAAGNDPVPFRRENHPVPDALGSVEQGLGPGTALATKVNIPEIGKAGAASAALMPAKKGRLQIEPDLPADAGPPILLRT